jgi:hypothetical protein
MAELEDWEVAEIKLEGVHLGTQSAPNPEPVFNAPRVDQPAGDVIPEREVPLDDALIAACENPRERMVVLQLEDTILKFVKSSEISLEFPSGLNSFRRLVVYRLADRFGLQKGQIQIDANEKTLRLLKSPNICIPRPLLIDFKDSLRATSGNTASPMTVSQSSSESAPDAESSSSKKVMLIKRKPGDNSSSSGKVSNNKPQLTAEDRERAYQEARARIFGDAAGTSDQASSLSSSTSPQPAAVVDGSAHDIASIAKSISGTNLSVPAGVGAESTTGDDATNMKRSTSGGQIFNPLSNQANNLTSGSGKMRAQLRGSEAERFDPDFVRRGNNNNSGRYSGNNSPNYSNIRTSNQSVPAAPPRGYASNNAYYSSNSSGYMEASSMTGLNPHAHSWAQHPTSNQSYAAQNTAPPPPSLVTPNASYETGQYARSPYQYQYQLPSAPMQQQYGYYSPPQYPVGSGYDYDPTTGYYHPAAAGAPQATMIMTPATYNAYSHSNNNQYTSQGGNGKRASSSTSQSEFPPLR